MVEGNENVVDLFSVMSRQIRGGETLLPSLHVERLILKMRETGYLRDENPNKAIVLDLLSPTRLVELRKTLGVLSFLEACLMSLSLPLRLTYPLRADERS